MGWALLAGFIFLAVLAPPLLLPLLFVLALVVLLIAVDFRPGFAAAAAVPSAPRLLSSRAPPSR
ncbi:MAG: hypothetical protein NTZ26_15635 [Candidatus Aminicenantes bacterium]|nr:hypothetical protein [Candidatus Aminicenantes bacterium]